MTLLTPRVATQTTRFALPFFGRDVVENIFSRGVSRQRLCASGADHTTARFPRGNGGTGAGRPCCRAKNGGHRGATTASRRLEQDATLAALSLHLGRDGAHAMKDGCDGAAGHQARHRGPSWARGIACARRCRKRTVRTTSSTIARPSRTRSCRARARGTWRCSCAANA